MIEALEIRVKGIVQGVGFRPFVYTMAKKYDLTGWVLNQTAGVLIHAEGEADNLDAFIVALSNEAPEVARVKKIDIAEVEIENFQDFQIKESSEEDAQLTTLVSPDLATCDECVAELFDPENRRYRYPFINCTNCGPRFTIMKNLPYDRKNTSMAQFEMCPECQAEFDNPANRRFHAQPDACFECGPMIGWVEAGKAGSETVENQVGVGEAGASGVTGSGATEAGTDIVADAEAGVAGAGVGAISITEADVAWVTDQNSSDEIIGKAVEALEQGKIVAVKGLGGFHLVCDASNADAVASLRARKKRSNKPFAVMAATVEQAKEYCQVSVDEEQQLKSAAAPIVLLKKKSKVQLAAGLADGLPELGIMLPSTPVQHLLAHDFGGLLVMTSGNTHDEPIVIDNQEAFDKLGSVADAFLVNNRAIEARYDDSVLRVLNIAHVGSVVQVIRRARGFAPLSVAMPQVEAVADAAGSGSDGSGTDGVNADGLNAANVVKPIFAAGSEQKNTFTYVRSVESGEGDSSQTGAATEKSQPAAAASTGTGITVSQGGASVQGGVSFQDDSASAVQAEAFVSQHIGDMEDAETYDAWLTAKQTYANLFRMDEIPATIACDYHPEYLPTKWAESAAQNNPGTTLVKVQHHHAHVVATMAENNVSSAVCGIAFDGTGYGADGSIWGGEVLLANLSDYERFANFAYFPLPGGAAAIKNPLRCAYGVLWANDLLEHPQAQAIFEQSEENVELLDQMIEKGLNTPMTSSVGRLFDAASALLGICPNPTYEGEAAVMLEAAAHEYLAKQVDVRGTIKKARRSAYKITAIKNVATETSTAHDTSVILFDAAAVFEGLLNDMQQGVEPGLISLRFHEAFVGAILQAAQFVQALYDINIVVLSGGVFMNRYLTEQAVNQLQFGGYTVALNKELPPNDGSVSYGQAVVALHQ